MKVYLLKPDYFKDSSRLSKKMFTLNEMKLRLLIKRFFTLHNCQVIMLECCFPSGGFVFSLINENGTKIELGQSSGLLVARRAGLSQVRERERERKVIF